MTNSKFLIFGLLAALLIFGCVAPQQPTENVTPNVTPPANVTPPPPSPPPPPGNQTNVTPSSCNWTNPMPDSAEEGLLRYSTGSTVEAVALSDYGYRAVAGGTDHSIYYFKPGSQQPFYTYETGNQVNSVSMSRNGHNYVAGSWDGKVYYFECDQSAPSWTYNTKQDDENPTVRSVAITKDGRWIAAVTETKLYVFNSSGSAPLIKADLGIPDYQIETVGIADDGSKVVVGTSNNGLNSKVFLVNAKDGQRIWEYAMVDLRWADNVPVPVAISSDGSVVAAGGSDNTIHLWTGTQSSPAWAYKIANESFVYSVSLSDDGKALAATGDSRLFYFADTSVNSPTWINDGTFFDENDESRQGYWGIGNKLHSADISEDGLGIVAADYVYGHLFTFTDGDNESMEMYDMEDGNDGVEAVMISPDGSYAIAGSSLYGEILRFKAG